MNTRVALQDLLAWTWLGPHSNNKGGSGWQYNHGRGWKGKCEWWHDRSTASEFSWCKTSISDVKSTVPPPMWNLSVCRDFMWCESCSTIAKCCSVVLTNRREERMQQGSHAHLLRLPSNPRQILCILEEGSCNLKRREQWRGAHPWSYQQWTHLTWAPMWSKMMVYVYRSSYTTTGYKKGVWTTSPMLYQPHLHWWIPETVLPEKKCQLPVWRDASNPQTHHKGLLLLQRSAGNPTGDKPWTSIARTPGNPQRHSCPCWLSQIFRCLQIHQGEIHAQRNTCLWRQTRTTWHRLGGWPFQQWKIKQLPLTPAVTPPWVPQCPFIS